MTHYLKTIADKLVRTTRDSADKTRTGNGRKTDAVAVCFFGDGATSLSQSKKIMSYA